jgi:hypothetical protein
MRYRYEARVLLYLRDGTRETVRIDPDTLGLSPDFPALPTDVQRSVVEEVLERRLNRELVEKVEVSLLEGEYCRAEYETPETDVPDVGNSHDVSGCRRLLQLANFVLPPSVREDALDEWMDEIQSAAEEGLPFRRRALSILFRSLPALALRARLPVRARRGEG